MNLKTIEDDIEKGRINLDQGIWLMNELSKIKKTASNWQSKFTRLKNETGQESKKQEVSTNEVRPDPQFQFPRSGIPIRS